MNYLNQGISQTTPTILNVVSTQRVNFPVSSSTNFRVQFAQPILHADNVSLETAVIPNNIIVFNNSNTQGYRVNTWIDFIDSTLVEKNINIATGTYDITALMAEIKTKMESVSPDTFTLTYDPITLLLTITSSSPNFNLLFATGANASQSIYYELGFLNTDTGLAAAHTGIRAVNIAGPPNLFITIGQLKNVINDVRFFSSCFQIPMSVSFGQFKYWSKNNEYNTDFNIQLKNLTYLDVILTSDFGPVNIQNSDWGFTLKFTQNPA